jgi:hypothetical protein
LIELAHAQGLLNRDVAVMINGTYGTAGDLLNLTHNIGEGSSVGASGGGFFNMTALAGMERDTINPTLLEDEAEAEEKRL